MKKYDGGGAAFPCCDTRFEPTPDDFQTGMTLWDYFAAHAPAAIFDCGGTTADAAKELGMEVGSYICSRDWPKLCAKYAADFADAMIAERRKRMELK